jgi:flagellar hook-basal body complex protein FliE
MAINAVTANALKAFANAGASSASAAQGPAFGDVLKGMLDQTVEAQKSAESLTLQAANGGNVALQDVVQAVSQAQITLQTLVTVRDKAVEAYQEIMRMAV